MDKLEQATEQLLSLNVNGAVLQLISYLKDLEKKEPVKVRVERPKTLEQESGLEKPVTWGQMAAKIENDYLDSKMGMRIGFKEPPQDTESPMKDSHLGVGLASIPPAIPQSLHLPTEYIQDFALHVAHCSNCRGLVERHLQYPFRMPVEDANGKHR